VKIPQSTLESAQSWMKEHVPAEFKIAIISTGTSKRRQSKCWPIDRWQKLIEILYKKGYFAVIVGAPAEAAQLNALASRLSYKPAVYAGENGILFLAALMKCSDIFIGIDSGAMHLAASVGLPVIALFGHTDPLQVGPMPLEKNIVIKADDVHNIKPEEVIKKM
jgi:ADP-heptose:LPS heptosyltransferase